MAEEDDVSASPSGFRSFWNGTITFGLVSVPVALFAATRPRSVNLRMVSGEGSPIQRRYVCSKDEQQLDNDDLVRGYEISKGKFVVVEDDELEAIEPRKTREIDLQLFVKVDDIEPMYFERAYFLTPAGGSNKAYRLLAEVMERTGRAGIATFVMRAKEYLVAIIAENGILRAETLRFHDEIRKPADVGLPKKTRPNPAEVKKFENLIAKRSGKVNFREFLDDHAKRLEALVQRKQKKNEDVVKARAEDTRDEQSAEVVDLLSVLTRSLKSGAAAAESRPRKTAAKRTPARKRAPAKKAGARKGARKKKAS
ncbi:MAG TPA: Ku protein [Thermoanaerobaculia bacterium]